MSRREKTWWIVAGIGIVIYALFPIAWIVSLSLKAPSDLANGQFLPTAVSWENYELILTGAASDLFLPALRNSFGIVPDRDRDRLLPGDVRGVRHRAARLPGQEAHPVDGPGRRDLPGDLDRDAAVQPVAPDRPVRHLARA